MINFIVQLILGSAIADVILGIYHWIKDTYFTPFTPYIGKKFIWSSRLHHIRPKYVVEFSDWDLFMSSGKWVAIWMVPLFYLIGITPFSMTLFLFMAGNDIIHKYSHMTDFERPIWATFLQKIHVFQNHDEHHYHHTFPFITHYCPTTSFVNYIFEYLNFWRTLEHLIERYFKVKPRAQEFDFIEDFNYPAGVRFLNQPIGSR